jgi:hypothetical protein
VTLMLDVARAAAAVNVVLLLALGYVWANNYRQIRSQQTLGTLLFALLLLAENGMALYYYFSAVSLPLPAIQAMMVLNLLETAAIAFLTYVTYT